MPLAERLRHGLASAVLSTMALVPSAAEAGAPKQPLLAQSQGSATPPAKNRQTPSKTKPTAPKLAPAATAKPPAGKGSAPTAAGCGAHDGGCGPAR